MRVLLVDNYDSYTFNLYQLIARVVGRPPIVIRNDAHTWDQVDGASHDAIVLSPGPGHPGRADDFGICPEIIRKAAVPVLGVCLGHQGIAHTHGGTVAHAREPMHGRITRVQHNEDQLFADIPRYFQATRYHSLAVHEPLPPALDVIAWDDLGTVMALRERERPVWGVQFHPESVGTPIGEALMRNFFDAADSPRTSEAAPELKSVVPRRTTALKRAACRKVTVRRVSELADGPAVFECLFRATPHAFWLDSSSTADGAARFSFLGTAAGECGQLASYSAATGVTSVLHTRDGTRTDHAMSILEFLDEQIDRTELPADLPFELQTGFVGYLAYELKAICDGQAAHRSALPDAQFIFADRLVVLDHREHDTYVVTVRSADTDTDADEWQEAATRVVTASPVSDRAELPPTRRTVPADSQVTFELRRGRDDYESDIRRCQELIRDGESYEICLTNVLGTSQRPDPFETYLALRYLNPAPYSAFLRFGDVHILSASPERFLKVTGGVVEAKPMKGTRRRAMDRSTDEALREDLSTSIKDRAENLMIVDLLRNDLGLVCEIGTVTVPKLMNVESYATVHQLVSTIRGQLREEITLGDCLSACFPGGSMTGAPKKRTMSIIDQLEPGPRGIYSGAIGFLDTHGSADLSIVIRTIVIDPSGTSIGSGGAITLLSDPAEEFDEIVLKATPSMEAIAFALTGRRDGYKIANAERQASPDET